MATPVDNHIEYNSNVRSGKPRIAGTRIAVSDIILMHLRLGQSLEEIAGKYELSLAAVHAAMAYYYDHQAEVDRSLEEDRAFAEAFQRNNPSLLHEKLNALSHG